MEAYVHFSLVPTGIDLEPEGLSMTFVSRIQGFSGWRCGKTVPTHELQPAIYGEVQ